MKSNKSFLKSTLICCVIVLSFISKSFQYETIIRKNVDFDLFSRGRNNFEGDMTFSMCFSGVSSKTKSLIFKDQKVALNTIVSSSINIATGMYSQGQLISSVVWDSVKLHYVLTDVIFKTFSPQNVYCLVFNTNSSANGLKNLSLLAGESNNNGALVYNSIKDFSSIELYNVKESALFMNNFSFSTQTIYPTTEFNLKVQFNVRLHPNRIIPSSEDLVTLVLDFENMLVNTVDITTQPVSILANPAENEPLKASLSKIPNFDEKGSTITLDSFGENFRNGRSFFLTFSRLRSIGQCCLTFKLRARLFWKNTNSVISVF